MIRPARLLCAALLAMILLGGCAGIDVEQYRAEKPRLDLRKYFSGTVDGWGMFQDRSGKVVKRFNVVIDARWEGNQGTLDERFTWSDFDPGGNPARRVWTLTDLGDGRFVGRAGDVVGEAQGQASGNARAALQQGLGQRPADARRGADDPDTLLVPVDDGPVHGARRVNDSVTSPSVKPNLLITERLSMTRSSTRNIQSSKST